MFQQIIAIIIIIYFISRIFIQKKNKQIQPAEFGFWLFFWTIALVAVLLIKQIDVLVAKLGFSGRGIEILFYIGFLVLVYLVFKMRLHIAKMDQEITKIVREIALKDK